MYKKVFLLFVLFFSLQLCSQNLNFEEQKEVISNLLKQYKKTKDTIFIKKALSLSKETNNDSIIREVNIVYGIQSYYKRDLKNLKKSEENVYAIFKKNNDSLALAKFYHLKALSFRIQYISDSCFYYYHKSKDISIQLKDSLQVGIRLSSMAYMQKMERDYKGCEFSIVEGLKFLEPLHKLKSITFLYSMLGGVLQLTDRQEEARKTYLTLYKLRLKSKDKKTRYLAKIYYSSSLAKTFEGEGKNEKAKKYYKESLDDDSLFFKSTHDYELALEGFSYNNFMLGNKKEALSGYLEVFKSRKKRKNKRGLVFSHSLLGELYASNKQTQKAIFHTKKALTLAKEINFSERILENLFLLSKLVKGEKGRQYLQEHFILNDSLFKRERSVKNQFAKIRYETEKKDKENIKLKVENDRKQLQLESEKQQKTIGWLAAGISFIFIVLGTTVASNRRKKLEYKSKLQQVEAREKERQQIAKSLHDEVAGDIRMLYLKLANTNQVEEAKKLNTIKENVRHLSHQLSSVSFDEVSFKNQIINLISDYFDADFRIKMKEINAVQWKEINSSIKRTLFLSIRESLLNIDKYAAAKNVILSFSETKKAIFLTINDDGKGFNVNKKKKGIGLKNMKERIEEINGNFSLKSELNKGTTIEIEIPKNGR